MGTGADGWGVVDDDFPTGTAVELEDDVEVDTEPTIEEEETDLPLCFGDLSCNDAEI